jgi:hypothetical protein
MFPSYRRFKKSNSEPLITITFHQSSSDKKKLNEKKEQLYRYISEHTDYFKKMPEYLRKEASDRVRYQIDYLLSLDSIYEYTYNPNNLLNQSMWKAIKNILNVSHLTDNKKESNVFGLT